MATVFSTRVSAESGFIATRDPFWAAKSCRPPLHFFLFKMTPCPIVETPYGDREVIATDGLELHAAETEGAIALNGKHRLAADDSCANRITHAYAHYAPRSGVETLAGLAHIDDVTTEIERICAL